MKRLILVLLLASIASTIHAQVGKSKAPNFALGSFKDDYGISYLINDTLWVQNPNTKYLIIKWNTEQQYLVAKNAVTNKADANKYTRIDYMTFTGMEPFLWGFCLTVYDSETDEIAEQTAYVDRKNPKKGCNGYPFSRMKRVEENPKTN